MTKDMIAIIFYSRSNNTKFLAEFLKETIEKKHENVELIQITAKKRPGFLKAISAARKQEDLSITNDEFDLGKHQTLIIAMPSWAYYPAPFYKTYLNKIADLKSKKIALVLCAGVSIKRNVITMERFKAELEKFGVTCTAELIIIVRKGEIIDGKQDVDGFVDKITSEFEHH